MKWRYFIVAVGIVISMIGGSWTRPAVAANCPELKIIFARGSGGERWTDQNYLAFRDGLESKLSGTEIKYEFEDLDYPAVGIGDVMTLLGAFFGGGEAYEFGRSVNAGVERLVTEVNNACSDTKYVVAGYSQGAMVVSKALHRLDADKVIYSATFGDPKIYLPEGAGPMPAACSGLSLSDYRMYVPDCRAYLGKLGTYLPYQPEVFVGKMGTWCNKMDIFCSSYLSVASHTAYVADNLYEDAARVIFDRVAQAFEIKNTFTAPHDTAILIDSTGSMSSLISQYKSEALRLARKTLTEGGRVALYDYRDFRDGYTPILRCDFGCTIEEFAVALDGIGVFGGGDVPESVLGSSFFVMNELDWRVGATKSLVILTDAGYHEPDFDLHHTTLEDVVRLSQQIDPVNIYVITTPHEASNYTMLTSLTGGRVATTVDDLSLLTDEIIARYDALPRVEEWTDDGGELPWVEVLEVFSDIDTATIRFNSSDGRVMVALDDVLLGVVEGDEFTVGELDRSIVNELTLVPINETRSGAGVSVMIEAAENGVEIIPDIVIPLAPETGRA